jgi:hypothetical protein
VSQRPFFNRAGARKGIQPTLDLTLRLNRGRGVGGSCDPLISALLNQELAAEGASHVRHREERAEEHPLRDRELQRMHRRTPLGDSPGCTLGHLDGDINRPMNDRLTLRFNADLGL